MCLDCIEKIDAERKKIGRDEDATDKCHAAFFVLEEVSNRNGAASELYKSVSDTPPEVFDALQDLCLRAAAEFHDAACMLRAGKSRKARLERENANGTDQRRES